MFARPKEEMQQNSKMTQGSNFKPQSSQMRNSNVAKNQDQSQSHRLERIEAAVAKLSDQYDTLMPVLNLTINAPLLIKKENLIANIQKKYQMTEERSKENEKKIGNVNGTIEEIQKQLHSQIQNEMRNFEQKFQKLGDNMEKSLSTIEKNADRLSKVVKNIEGKQREELQISMKKYDQRYNELDSTMKSIQNEVGERLQQIEVERQKMKRSTVAPSNRRESTKQQFMFNQVEGQIEKKIQDSIANLTKSVENLQMDVGAMQCENEMTSLLEMEEHTETVASKFKKNMSSGEKSIRINMTEFDYIKEVLQRYNSDNSQRLHDELKAAEEKISKIDSLSKQYPANFQTLQPEVTQFEQRLLTLKQQVDGTNKKSQIEASKLEERVERLVGLKERLADDLTESQQLEISENFNQDELVHTVNEVKNEVQGNVVILQEALGAIQEKMKQYLIQRGMYLQQYSYMQSELTQKDDSSSAIRSGRQNTYMQKNKNNLLKNSFIKKSIIQPDQNRSNFTNDDSLQ